jgi:hypothetical protein
MPSCTHTLTSSDRYPHPYAYEIACLQFDAAVYTRIAASSSFRAVEDTPFTWIDTFDALQQLANKLDQVSEFAVDLEVFIPV